MEPIRVCVFITHPNQHFSPLFMELAKNRLLNLKVLYMFDHGASDSWDPLFGKQIRFSTPMTGNHEGY